MQKSGNAQSGERKIKEPTDVEEEIARIEEAQERIAWGQRLYDLEGE